MMVFYVYIRRLMRFQIHSFKTVAGTRKPEFNLFTLFSHSELKLVLISIQDNVV